MTSTYDHRIIQGAESGPLPAGRRGLPAGRARLLRGGLRATRRRSSAPAPAPPRAGRRAGRAAAREQPTAPLPALAAPDEELLQAVQAATSLVKAHRTHGHLAAQLDPLGSEPEGDPALDPEPLGLTPELMRRIPAQILRIGVAGRDARRRAAAPARDLLRHDRLRDRAHRLAPPAHVAAREDRVGRLPHAARRRGAAARCCAA